VRPLFPPEQGRLVARHVPTPQRGAIIARHVPNQNSTPQQGTNVSRHALDQNAARSLQTGTPSFSGQSFSHSTAHTSLAAESSEGAAQGRQQGAEEAAALPARSRKISIKIKAFRGDRSLTPEAIQSANHAPAESVPQQNGASASAPHASGSGVTKPGVKRKGRPKGIPGKKQKTGPVHDYLREAQRLVKGSCSRFMLLAQHQESSGLLPSFCVCLTKIAVCS
jgi:hypothetical protein